MTDLEKAEILFEAIRTLKAVDRLVEFQANEMVQNEIIDAVAKMVQSAGVQDPFDDAERLLILCGSTAMFSLLVEYGLLP